MLRIDLRLSSDKKTLSFVLFFPMSLESFFNNISDSSLNFSDKNSASLICISFLAVKGILFISPLKIVGKYFLMIRYIKNGDNRIMFIFTTFKK